MEARAKGGLDSPSGAPVGGRSWTIVQTDAISFLRRRSGVGPFDLIFADPPYDGGGRIRWLERIAEAVAAGQVLAPGGLLILEQGRHDPYEPGQCWESAWDRTYGETRVRMLRSRFGGDRGDRA